MSLEQSRDMMLEAEQLEQKENHLDDMISAMRAEVTSQLQNTTHAYITHQDLRGIEMLRDQMVIIIKVPQEAKLLVSVCLPFARSSIRSYNNPPLSRLTSCPT